MGQSGQEAKDPRVQLGDLAVGPTPASHLPGDLGSWLPSPTLLFLHPGNSFGDFSRFALAAKHRT